MIVRRGGVGAWAWPAGLTVVVLMALALRVWGSAWGLPHLYHPDEDKIVSHALAFGKGDLNPHYFGWPSLQMYVIFLIYACYFAGGWLLGRFGSPEDFVVAFAVDPSTFYLLGRWLSAVSGTLTVWLVYFVGRKLYGRGVGLLGGVLLAVNYLHVKDSHYVTPDVPVALVALAAFWMAVRVSEDPSPRNYVLAGLLTGVAVSVKYPGFVVGVSLLVAHLLGVRTRAGGVGLFSGRAWAAAAMIPLGFVMGTPYSVLDWQSFLMDLQHQQIQVSQPLSWAARLLMVLLENPLSALGAGVYALALGGTIRCLFRRGRPDVLLLSLPGAYLGFLLLTGGLQYRYLSVILPLFSLLAAVALVELGRASERFLALCQGRTGVLVSLVTLAVIVQPLSQSVALDLSLAQVDTRTRTAAWIERHIPAGSRIAVTQYGPPLLSVATETRDGVGRQPTVEEWRLSREQITEAVVYGGLKAARLGEDWRRYDALIDRERARVSRDRPRYRISKLASLPYVWELRLRSGEVLEESLRTSREFLGVLVPDRFLNERGIEYVVLSSSSAYTTDRWKRVLAGRAALIYRVEDGSAWWGGRLPLYSFHSPALEVYRFMDLEEGGTQE